MEWEWGLLCLCVDDSGQCCDSPLIHTRLPCVRVERQKDMMNLCLLIFCQNCTSFQPWLLFSYERTVIRGERHSRGARQRVRHGERERERGRGVESTLFGRREEERLRWRDNSKLIEGHAGVAASCDWLMLMVRRHHRDQASFLSSIRQSPGAENK